MSFRLFVYYCAVCGGWAGLVGWGIGALLRMALRSFGLDDPIYVALVFGTSVGASIAFGLALIDGLWNTGGRQWSAVGLRAAVGGIAGLLCTIPGALIGQSLVNVTHFRPLAAFGWTLTGILIGATVGMYDTAVRMAAGEGLSGAIRKVINGTVGGLAGGLVGGIIYVIINAIFDRIMKGATDSYSGSLVGFVVLGICIGLAVGLAQVILKEAWVKVESGFRAGRELILTKDQTTIGRAESCDLGLYGDTSVERDHARIVVEKNRYLLVDAGTPGGTYINDQRITQPTPLGAGDRIRVGRAVIRFDLRQKKPA